MLWRNAPSGDETFSSAEKPSFVARLAVFYRKVSPLAIGWKLVVKLIGWELMVKQQCFTVRCRL